MKASFTILKNLRQAVNHITTACATALGLRKKHAVCKVSEEPLPQSQPTDKKGKHLAEQAQLRFVQLRQCQAFERLEEVVAKNRKPTRKLWSDLWQAVVDNYPEVATWLLSHSSTLSTIDKALCIAFCYGLRSNLVATLLNTTPQNVCNHRQRINQMLFKERSSRNFSVNLITIDLQ